MKVLVIGAGALGSLIGGILSVEHDVTVIGRKAQVDVINDRGIRIKGLTRGEYHPKAVVDLPDNEEYDLIILCVKSYNTELTLAPLSGLMRENTWVLSLQNGLDNEERILKYLRQKGLPGRVIGGITCHGVTYKEPGLVKHAGIGDTMIGPFGTGRIDLMDEEIISIARHFKSAGMDVDVTPDIDREIWAKTIINSAINPLTAITREKNGIVINNPEINRIALQIIEEGVRVANGFNIDLTIEEMTERTFKTARRTSSNRSSMLQDVILGRRTEIESINGAIWRKGMEIGLSAPVNRLIYHLVRGLEEVYLVKPSGKE
jgi:2-dehydropantoate 2-reductase